MGSLGDSLSVPRAYKRDRGAFVRSGWALLFSLFFLLFCGYVNGGINHSRSTLPVVRSKAGASFDGRFEIGAMARWPQGGSQSAPSSVALLHAWFIGWHLVPSIQVQFSGPAVITTFYCGEMDDSRVAISLLTIPSLPLLFFPLPPPPNFNLLIMVFEFDCGLNWLTLWRFLC